MRFTIADDVLALFPAPVLGIVGGEVASPRPDFPERLRSLQESALARLRAAAPDVEGLMAHPNVRVWRDAYQRFGTKPTKFRPTHEAFARRLALCFEGTFTTRLFLPSHGRQEIALE